MDDTLPILTMNDASYEIPIKDRHRFILEKIQLKINAGDTIAITGPSGVGKSTLLSLMGGLMQPSHGDIQLMQQPFSRLNEDQRATLRGQHMGFVFQSYELFDHLNVVENVALPLLLKGHKDAFKLAHTALLQVRLKKRAHCYPTTLSGGEQQRAAIARAFVTKPAILLADEPTGNLDSQSANRVSSILWELNANHGSALVIVTHDQQLAERCRTRYTLMNKRLHHDH